MDPGRRVKAQEPGLWQRYVRTACSGGVDCGSGGQIWGLGEEKCSAPVGNDSSVELELQYAGKAIRGLMELKMLVLLRIIGSER